jgi:hypothetical protein
MASIDSVHYHRKDLTWCCLSSLFVFSMPFLFITAPEFCLPKQGIGSNYTRRWFFMMCIVKNQMKCMARTLQLPCLGNRNCSLSLNMASPGYVRPFVWKEMRAGLQLFGVQSRFICLDVDTDGVRISLILSSRRLALVPICGTSLIL